MPTVKSASLNIRIDPKLKEQLLRELDGMGLDASTFVTMAAKQAVRQHGLPFVVTNQPTELEKAIAEVQAGNVVHHGTVDDYLKEVDGYDEG